MESLVANLPDINKKQFNLRIPIEVYKKLSKLSRKLGKRETEAAVSLIEDGVRNIGLTSADYEEIMNEVRENERKRRNSRSDL